MSANAGGKKERGSSAGFFYVSATGGGLWRIQVVFFLLFLAAAGVYSWFAMRPAACRLAGGPSEDSSAGSRLYENADEYAGREGGFFQGQGKAEEQPAEKDIRSGLAGPVGTLEEIGISGKSDGSSASSAEPVAGKSAEAGQSPYKGSVVSGGNPRMTLGGLPLPQGNSGTGSSSRSLDSMGEGLKSRVSAGQEGGRGAGASSGREGSVLDGLKRAWKNGVYGSREASLDTAHDWTAKSFDAVPSNSSSLEYSEKVRNSLDRVNPASIPNYLREFELSAAPSLSAAKVDGLEESGRGKDSNSQARQLAEMMMSQGLMNPLFGGISGGSYGAGSYPGGYGGAGAGSYGKPSTGGMSDPGRSPSMKNMDLSAPDSGKGYFTNVNGCQHYCTASYCDLSCWN